MGIGIIVRDFKGLVCAGQSKIINCLRTRVMAGAVGALWAAEFCRDFGLQDVILEGDSLIVVQDIHAMTTNWSAHGQIVANVWVVLGSLRSWMIWHTKRGTNQAQHGLAKMAVRTRMDWIWIEGTSNYIFDIVTLEQTAFSV